MELDREPRKISTDWCNQLSRGAPYFTISYFAPGVNLSSIETLVYLGSVQLKGDDGPPCTSFLFQDAASYQRDGDWSELSEERRAELADDDVVMFYSVDSVGSIADMDGLLVLLTGLKERMRRGLGWERSLPKDE